MLDIYTDDVSIHIYIYIHGFYVYMYVFVDMYTHIYIYRCMAASHYPVKVNSVNMATIPPRVTQFDPRLTHG